MTSENKGERKKIEGHRLRAILLTAAIASLIFTVSGSGMPVAAAIFDVAIDYGIGCGHGYWGVKNYQNDNGFHDDFKFGKLKDCTDNPAEASWFGRDNYVKLAVHNDGAKAEDIAWQAIIQGNDPWNCPNCAADNFPPQNSYTDNFPHDATKNYNLRVQWLWTNDLKPEASAGADNLRAYMLTNLWFKSPNTNRIVVIDFLWDALSNNNGNWQQKSFIDNDLFATGTQYYDTFCRFDGTYHVYHYNVVLDNEARSANTWYEKVVNINTYIDDAFGSHYAQTDGCSSNDPGARSFNEVLDIETGAEIWNRYASDYASFRGGYSFSELYY